MMGSPCQGHRLKSQGQPESSENVSHCSTDSTSKDILQLYDKSS